jgi:hypothetical protein
MVKIQFFLIFLKVTSFYASFSFKYDVQRCLNISSSNFSLWYLQSLAVKTKFACLSQCNLNDDCYTTFFISDPNSNNNCISYTKFFDQSELVTSINTDIYAKNCIYNIKHTLFNPFYNTLFFFRRSSDNFKRY